MTVTTAPQISTKAILSATTPKSATFDLPGTMSGKFDRLSQVRNARLELEAEEKAIKGEILDMLPERAKGIKFVLRVGGVIRANVSKGSRTNVKPTALLEAFPEAYEALATETFYDQVTPA